MAERKVDLVILLPRVVGGGAERVSLNLAKILLQKGFSVTVICFGFKPDSWVAADVEVLFLGKKGFLTSLVRIISMLNKLKPRFVFSTFSYINISLVLLKSLLFPRIICREANLHQQDDLIGWKNRIIYRLLFLYNFADTLICSSSLMKNHFMREHRIRKGKIFVWHNPVDIENLQKLASMPFPYEKELTGPAETAGRKFVAIGRLEPQKNFGELIDWFVEGSGATDTLFIVGSGSQMASLEVRSRGARVGGRVKLCGHQDNPYKIMDKRKH